MSLIQAARTDLRAPQKTNRSLAKNALASLLRRTDALSLSKRLHTSPVNDACASFTDAVLDSLLFENRRVPLPRTRDHLRVPTAECVFLRRNFPTISSAICLACANPRNQLVPLRRAQDANSRSAEQVCQADSCTLVQLFFARVRWSSAQRSSVTAHHREELEVTEQTVSREERSFGDQRSRGRSIVGVRSTPTAAMYESANTSR